MAASSRCEAVPRHDYETGHVEVRRDGVPPREDVRDIKSRAHGRCR